MELGLGTAQLGLAYGVNNSKGHLSDDEAAELLYTAREAGFRWLDVSTAYGKAEERVGRFLRANPESFKVIAKYPTPCDPQERVLAMLHSLDLMGRIDYAMYWTTGAPLAPEDLEGCDGLSISSASELPLAERRRIVELPGNILDGRMDAEIPRLRWDGKKVLLRSLLLQGLLATTCALGNVGNGAFYEGLAWLCRLKEIAERYDMSTVEMAIRWVWHVWPDIALVGCETPGQVQQTAAFWRRGRLPDEAVKAVLELRRDVPEALITPRMWGQVFQFTGVK